MTSPFNSLEDSMRDPVKIIEDINAIKKAMDAKRSDMTLKQVNESDAKITTLQAELQTVLTDGAKPCPTCKRPPHGMIKNPGNENHEGAAMIQYPTYEVGCTSCKPVSDGNYWIQSLARGPSVAHAVKAWNEGKRVRKLKEKEELEKVK